MKSKKIISIEDRMPKLKKIRRKKANRRLIFYLSIFFLLIALIVYLQSPLSYIHTINIDGNILLSDEEIIEQSKLTKQTNIWSIKPKTTTQLLEEHSIIQSAQVKRKFPTTIEIQIEEHELVGLVEEQREYFLLLDNGTLIKRPTFQISHAPLVVNFNGDMFIHLAEQLAKLPSSISRLISEIHFQQDHELDHKILIYMNDGFTVSVSLRSFADQMRAYPSIITQLDADAIGTIHLGLDAYFEPYDSK